MAHDMKPLKNEEWPDLVASLRDGFAGRLNIYRVMAHRPELLAAWAPLRDHVVRNHAMTDQQSEVVILRTGFHMQSAYEWTHHVSRGRAAGLSDDRIAALAGPRQAICAEDRTLASAVDELIEDARLLPDTRNALTALIGTDGMFDLMATVGFYTTLSFVANSLDVPIDSGVAAELQDRPVRGI